MSPDKTPPQAPGSPIGWYNDVPVSHPAQKPVDPEDPFDTMALRVPFEDPDQGLLEAATCYVEELITMGYTDLMILSLFRKPFYMGLNPIYEKRGADFAKQLIADRRADLADNGLYPR